MPAEGYDEVVLVTGFPAFRGRKMVEELLRAQPRSLVYVVVKPQFAADAEAALSHLDKKDRDRVAPIEGDAAAMDLGLSGKEYRELAARVDRIHHVAQVTYPGASRDMAEAVNVGGSKEIVELGRVCEHLKCIVFHSSATVSGSRTGLVLEDELSAGQTFRTPVEETLARAERIARGAMKEVPVVVVRPTQIVGDSTSGEVDRFDGPYLLIMLIVSSPQDFPVLLPTRGDAPMHMVPIDYVVDVARHIGRKDAAIGRTFHVADPTPLTVRRVYELVARAGGKRLPSGFIPSNVTRALLRAPGLHQVAQSPRAFLDLIATPVRYDARGTEEMLRGAGITCPPFEDYVEQIVAYVKQRVRERRVQAEALDAEVDDPLA